MSPRARHELPSPATQRPFSLALMAGVWQGSGVKSQRCGWRGRMAPLLSQLVAGCQPPREQGELTESPGGTLAVQFLVHSKCALRVYPLKTKVTRLLTPCYRHSSGGGRTAWGGPVGLLPLVPLHQERSEGPFPWSCCLQIREALVLFKMTLSLVPRGTRPLKTKYMHLVYCLLKSVPPTGKGFIIIIICIKIDFFESFH